MSENQPRSLNAFYLALFFVLIILVGMFAKSWWQKQNAVQPAIIDQQSIVSKIQTLSRLQTVAVSVDTVITSDKQGSWQKLWQDRQKGLFVARGRVLAGVDLSKISAESVQVQHRHRPDGTSTPHAIISVPPSEVFEVFLDDIKVYDWQTGLFGAMGENPEVLHDAQKQAKNEVLSKACASDVMNMAATNAQEQIKHLFLLGDVSVEVISQGSGACRL